MRHPYKVYILLRLTLLMVRVYRELLRHNLEIECLICHQIELVVACHFWVVAEALVIVLALIISVVLFHRSDRLFHRSDRLFLPVVSPA